jgi:plastocyanin
MKSTRVLATTVSVLMLTLTAWAQHHDEPAPSDAAVDFGVFVSAPIPGTGCATTGFGGPNDPCSYKLHHLTPEEVTIAKGGQVTFQVHGGGHGFALYEVSKNTTRDELGQFLCPGTDPETITNPTMHTCNLSASNANALHNIADGKGDIVIVASASTSTTPVHPENRVWYEPGRLMSVGGQQFINGGTTATNGQLLTYRFLKTGRYLVICMNRVHFLNDWMFGFVNVVGE